MQENTYTISPTLNKNKVFLLQKNYLEEVWNPEFYKPEFLENRKGSHEAWINKNTQAIVEINFHGTKSFPPRTVETMIRQSKMDKKEWRKWAGS